MNCQHNHVEKVELSRATEYATREMAMDAGDLALEGFPVDGGSIYALQCQECGEILEPS